MDLMHLELAAKKFFEMCAEHPEICPHDYRWQSSRTDKTTGTVTEVYVCSLCKNDNRKTIKK